MALQFLTDLDLKSGIIDKLIYERNEEGIPEILESIEMQNISLIRTKLASRYNVDAIFKAIGVERHYLIVKILLKLCLYDFVRRNAARKVPDDYMKDWEWAMKQLEAIKAGKDFPDGLPIVVDDTGEEAEGVIYANNKNTDYYI